MNPTIKSKWLTALRSGSYAQGRTQLYSSREYCCLGVLLETMGAKVKNDALHYEEEYCGGIPPSKALEEAGISRKNAWELAHFNDQGWTFKRIAEYIERNL